MNKSDIFWQTYLNFEQKVKEIAKYIFIADEVNVHRKIAGSGSARHSVYQGKPDIVPDCYSSKSMGI